MSIREYQNILNPKYLKYRGQNFFGCIFRIWEKLHANKKQLKRTSLVNERQGKSKFFAKMKVKV